MEIRTPLDLRNLDEVRHLRDSIRATPARDVAECARAWEQVKDAVDSKLDAARQLRGGEHADDQ